MDGVTSKSWTTQDGKVREGKLIDKSLIYKLLGNRTYLGELRHKEEWFKGEHQPLIEPSTWEAVQSILKVSPRTRGNNTRATIPFLLKSIVQGADGRGLTVAWSRKGTGKLYRYYIHTRENKEHAGASGLPRLPAIELEANVVAQMRSTQKPRTRQETQGFQGRRLEDLARGTTPKLQRSSKREFTPDRPTTVRDGTPDHSTHHKI